MYLMWNIFLLGVYNQRKTTAPSTAAPPYSSGGNLNPNLIPTSSQPHSFSSTTTPMGPILPLAPYELKHPTLSSGVSQPLSSIGNDFPGISRVTSTSGPVPTRRSNLSNTLPSPRRRQQMKEMLEAKPSSKDDSSGVKPANVRLLFLLDFLRMEPLGLFSADILIVFFMSLKENCYLQTFYLNIFFRFYLGASNLLQSFLI